MSKRKLITYLFYNARDIRSRRLFRSLKRYCQGAVLDVGGWDFYRTAGRKGIPFDSWTILEVDDQSIPILTDRRVDLEIGDGCHMNFHDESYDTVLNVQVLEHVFEPNSMMREMCRVLKPGGHLIILIPQTSTLHMVPHHYYNFTRFWAEEALRRNGMEQIELQPIGGIWSSMASHLVYFLFQSLRYPGMSTVECKRSLLFYLYYPIMILFVAVALPISMILSLGDLSEEPNNHLVIARKPKAQSGKGRSLAAPPHTTWHAGPHQAVRGNHRAVAGW